MAKMCSSATNAVQLQTLFILLCVLFALTGFCSSSKLYVVYMGNKGNHESDEILRQNHQMLTAVHKGSVELAEASHVYSYKHGFRGFAAKLTEEQASQLAEMPEVISVFPNTKRSLHTTHSWDFMGLLGEETMEIPGYSTKNQVNVVIGFIDSGIWPESESFSDAQMPPVPPGWKGHCQTGESFNVSSCNRKVIGARYYLSGYEAEEELDKTSFRSPRDANGHGSHTASTAAGRYVNNMNFRGLGSGGARGGAPMARIAVYKTCWNYGCYDVDVLAAFDDAINDGVNILSLSLGSGEPQIDYFSDSISVGSFHAVNHGISVVASVGNEGLPGSALNLAPWIITVAASSTDRDFTSDIILGNGARLSGESTSHTKMNYPTKIIFASEANAGYFTPYQSSYCLESSLNYTKAKGKVLVCRHAGNSVESKVAKAAEVKRAGGVGMVLIDEADMDIAIPFDIPAAIVGNRVGYKIMSYLNKTRNPTAKILSAKTVIGSQAAPRVAFFSSKGPNSLTPEILKPDVTAPGVNILAAWSPAIGKMNYNIISGTSMACPHVTGIVALIKAVHPTWSPSAIKSAIMTTATTLDKYQKPITEGPDGRKADPFDLGSGFLNPKLVLDPGLVYDSTPTNYKDFLCSIGYSERRVRRVTRDNSTCNNNNAFSTPSSLNYPSISVPNLKNTFAVSRTVTNVGSPRSIYNAVVVPPSGISVTVIPKQLVFSSYGQKLKYTVVFEVIAPSENYVFGSLTWRCNRWRVSSPLVVQTVHSSPGLRT